MFKKFTLGAAAVAAVAAIPAAAQAHPQGRAHGYYNNSAHSAHYRNSYDDRRYANSYNSYDDGRYEDRSYRRRCSGTTGTILGAAAGALLGRAVDTRGSRVLGTVVGGAGGAVVGRQLGKSTCRR